LHETFNLEINITYMLYLNYEVVYYLLPSGRIPVKEYLCDFNTDERAEIKRSFDFLSLKEGRLPAPYSKHVSKKIWELRIKYLNHRHRILYFIGSRRKIVLLSAFLKKTSKTPRTEIARANKYYLNYLSNTL